MDKIELVKSVYRAYENNDFERAQKLLTDDFYMDGAVPGKISAHDFIEMSRLMVKACPDMKFNDQDYRISGDKVICTVRISGTNNGVLDLPMMGIHDVPPTHKRVQLPRETNTFEIKGDKIYHWEVEAVPGGGVEGMLTQLNIQIPHHA